MEDVTQTSPASTEDTTKEATDTDEEPVGEDSEYEIITLLPKDAIRSIDDQSQTALAA